MRPSDDGAARMIRFARATLQHAAAVGVNLRAADAAELRAAGRLDPAQAVIDAVRGAADARTIVVEDAPVAVFGVTLVEGAAASPWMMSTEGIKRARRLIVRHMPRWRRAYRCRFGPMLNGSHADNRLHHRFIEHCGFDWVGEFEFAGARWRLFQNV